MVNCESLIDAKPPLKRFKFEAAQASPAHVANFVADVQATLEIGAPSVKVTCFTGVMKNYDTRSGIGKAA
jgi:hypothetical protein